MIIRIETRKPVPSLEVNELIYNRGWIFVYQLKSPHPFNGEPLYFKSGLVGLELTDKMPSDTINLCIYNENDIKKLFTLQRKADMNFRKQFNGLQRKSFILDNNKNYKCRAMITDYKNNRHNTTFYGRLIYSKEKR